MCHLKSRRLPAVLAVALTLPLLLSACGPSKKAILGTWEVEPTTTTPTDPRAAAIAGMCAGTLLTFNADGSLTIDWGGAETAKKLIAKGLSKELEKCSRGTWKVGKEFYEVTFAMVAVQFVETTPTPEDRWLGKTASYDPQNPVDCKAGSPVTFSASIGKDGRLMLYCTNPIKYITLQRKK